MRHKIYDLLAFLDSVQIWIEYLIEEQSLQSQRVSWGIATSRFPSQIMFPSSPRLDFPTKLTGFRWRGGGYTNKPSFMPSESDKQVHLIASGLVKPEGTVIGEADKWLDPSPKRTTGHGDVRRMIKGDRRGQESRGESDDSSSSSVAGKGSLHTRQNAQKKIIEDIVAEQVGVWRNVINTISTKSSTRCIAGVVSSLSKISRHSWMRDFIATFFRPSLSPEIR